MRCNVCGGKKKLLGMGCMEKPCGNCKGTGIVEDKPAAPVEVEKPEVKKAPAKAKAKGKRKGNPPKKVEKAANG